MKNFNKKNKGFTLIEILVVIGIIAILAAIVLIAINPARQFRQANNSQRTANVNALLNAIGQFVADNKGSLPDSVDDGDELKGDGDSTDDAGEADLCLDDLVPKYLPALPADPEETDQSITETECGNTYDTGYTVDIDAGRVTICAPQTVDVDTGGSPAQDICVTR